MLNGTRNAKNASGQVETITPSQALEELERMEKAGMQRRVAQSYVEALTASMKAGEFKMNGEAIIFDKEGVCLDGQHRLWAVTEYGQPVQFMVVRGVDRDTFSSIDSGRMRSARDLLVVTLRRGKQLPDLRADVESAVSSAVKQIMCIDAKTGMVTHPKREARPTSAQACEWIENHPDLMAVAMEFQDRIKNNQRCPLPMSALITLRYVTRSGFPEAIDTFFEPLLTGGDLPLTSPILKLRNVALQPSHPDFKRTRIQFAYLTKTWNYWTADQKINLLKFASGVDAYPIVRLRPGMKTNEDEMVKVRERATRRLARA